MMVITGELSDNQDRSYETFKMIPHHLECPYNEAIYDRDLQVLFVISKEKKNNLQKIEKKQDVVIEKYYEYHLTTHNEIVNFVNMFCTNADQFDFKRYLTTRT